MFEGRKEQMFKSIPTAPKVFLLSLIFLSLITFSFSMSVYALEDEDVVDFSQIPAKIAEALNIPLFPAQLITSCILMSIFLFPTLLLTRNAMAHLSVIVMTMGVCIALTWLPTWFLFIFCLLTALLFGSKVRTWISGH